MISAMALRSRGQAVPTPRIAEETPGVAMQSLGQAVTVPHSTAAEIVAQRRRVVRHVAQPRAGSLMSPVGLGPPGCRRMRLQTIQPIHPIGYGFMRTVLPSAATRGSG